MKIFLDQKLSWVFQKASVMGVMVFFLIACDHPRLFESQESPKFENSPLRGSNGDPVIALSITGGLAGVNKLLVIDSNGFMSFTDFAAGGASYTDYLTAAEYAELLAKFAAADFFHLDDEYMTPDAADLFWYDLTFRQNGASKRVLTDHLTAPEGLQAIIEALERIIDEMVANLQLTLTASRDSLKNGETVKLTLSVTNLSDAPLTLNFSDAQAYDFFAIISLPTNLRAPKRAWSWAHDKVFAQVLSAYTLAAGQRVSYEVEWDGRDNNGQLLIGDVLVGAELVSVPGGGTRLLPLRIQN